MEICHSPVSWLCHQGQALERTGRGGAHYLLLGSLEAGPGALLQAGQLGLLQPDAVVAQLQLLLARVRLRKRSAPSQPDLTL